MVKIGEFFMIRELYQKGWTIKAISEETGFDPKTIRKYIKLDTLPEKKPGEGRTSKLDPYKSYIFERIKEGTTNCEVLFDEIQSLGYQGKLTILREFVKPHRVNPKKQATLRFETPPGKQAQMDWGYVGKYLVDGLEKEVYAFVMVLGYSRMKYVEFTTSMDLETLMKCHMNAFAYFNGVPEQILYDNMKTAVIKHSPIEIRFNQKFEDFLAYYGIVPKACKPHRPQTKGKVENVVGYLKKNFMQRKHEPTIQALNENVRKWLDKTANLKPNATTNESPLKRFNLETKYLKTSNLKPVFPIAKWEIREVSRDSFISYRGKRYSVPYRFVGKSVKIKETLDHHIEVYDEYECIAKHPILYGKTEMHMNLEHYKGLKETQKGLATRLHQPNELEVEQRSLQVYEQLEGSET
ncbi:IS21 family transposase [Halalkalibacterium ligniniphilum]|uniref:IS21 family transposase n=1 Tax=Halalkalibacterium ligniniphilum TaxID=1134413 RepID=UPI000347826C|nr:IS21 family transposase [Halalkalibacterium ligniniphilum]